MLTGTIVGKITTTQEFITGATLGNEASSGTSNTEEQHVVQPKMRMLLDGMLSCKISVSKDYSNYLIYSINLIFNN
jgi:hypothetical protein